MGEGRQRYGKYCVKIFEHSTEEAKRKKKTDHNQARSVGTSSSVELYLLVRSPASFLNISVLNPKDFNSGAPDKKSAAPLKELKGIPSEDVCVCLGEWYNKRKANCSG